MTHPAETSYLGLAPFLRMSIGGGDLRPVAQALLELAQQNEDNAVLWMNLATAFFSIGEHDLGLSIQKQALLMQSTYEISASVKPARFRLLVLMAAGDIGENTPIDCLLDGSDIELIYHFSTIEQSLPNPLPKHDAVLVAICDSPSNRPILRTLEPRLRSWKKPVLNRPEHIPNTERGAASELLQNAPGICMPPTWKATRAQLRAIVARADEAISDFDGARFPVILRPVGSHAGVNLARIDDAAGIENYLATVDGESFYLSNFIDYSGSDGLFRKYRVAMIGGRPFACHMGISAHWMIHYVNAGMYDDAAKRAEESAFMDDFARFAFRHREALASIHERAALDYFCIDCAETRAGELLIFEFDHAMVVHAMDPEDLFPYKQIHMRKVRQAFEAFLFNLNGQPPATLAPDVA